MHEICSQYVNGDLCDSGVTKCKNCILLKRHLQVIISELKSARLIIKVHQEDSKRQNAWPKSVDNLRMSMTQTAVEKVTMTG